MNRLPTVSIEGLYILQRLAEGETDVVEILRGAILTAASHRRMRQWCIKAGIAPETAGGFAHDKTAGLTMYTATQLLKAQGLRLTIEVDE